MASNAGLRLCSPVRLASLEPAAVMLVLRALWHYLTGSKPRAAERCLLGHCVIRDGRCVYCGWATR